MFLDEKKNDRWAFIGGECLRVIASNEKDDSVAMWPRKKVSKCGISHDKIAESLKNITSTTMVIRLFISAIKISF